VVSGLLIGIIVVSPMDGEGPKEASNLESLPSLIMLAGLGLIERVNPVGSSLEQIADDLAGGLEERHAKQLLQLLDGQAVGLASLEASHQPSDFLFLGEEELGRVFFFEPASSARVLSITSWEY
jgi:hypothetical protein